MEDDDGSQYIGGAESGRLVEMVVEVAKVGQI